MTTRSGTADLPSLRIRGPADFVQLVPYLLGFHPDESLVLLGLTGPRIVVTVRMDLVELVDSDSVLAGTLAAMARGGARSVFGVVVDDRAVDPGARRPARLPWDGLLTRVGSLAEQVGMEVSDVLLVSNGRWWSFGCDEPRCCPPDGAWLDDLDSTVPATAAFAGMVALPDRSSVEALLEPAPDEAREALVPLIETALRSVPRPLSRPRGSAGRAGRGGPGRPERAAKRELFAAARAMDPPARPRSLSDTEVARFGALLRSTVFRDAAWLAVDDERLDGREFWRELARRLPGPYAAPPLFLFGWASWRLGSGALANIAAERAVAADPTYSAADLLAAALSQGLDPRKVPRLRRRSA